MFSQPSLDSLQDKYAKALKGEAIQDFIPVTFGLKKCNLVKTKTRLICLQDDINGNSPQFTLQNQSIERIVYSSYSITIKYPRSAPLKVSFAGINSHKNQLFAKSLPKSQPYKANSLELLLVGGGGLTLVSMLVIGAVFGPRSAEKAPPQIEALTGRVDIMNACKSAVSARLSNPSEADFENIFFTKPVVRNGPRYYWDSWVDAKNAFNATKRENFACIYDGQTATVTMQSDLSP